MTSSVAATSRAGRAAKFHFRYDAIADQAHAGFSVPPKVRHADPQRDALSCPLQKLPDECHQSEPTLSSCRARGSPRGFGSARLQTLRQQFILLCIPDNIGIGRCAAGAAWAGGRRLPSSSPTTANAHEIFGMAEWLERWAGQVKLIDSCSKPRIAWCPCLKV